MLPAITQLRHAVSQRCWQWQGQTPVSNNVCKISIDTLYLVRERLVLTAVFALQLLQSTLQLTQI